MAKYNFKKIFDMTVTSFLICLFAALGAMSVGILLYLFFLMKKFKESGKDILDSVDFHSVELNDGLELTVSKSLLNDEQYCVCLTRDNYTTLVYFDPKTCKILSSGSWQD